jgi:hypothetical protein
MPQARVAFQYSSFRYYMMARFLITASSEMQSVAIGWQVYNLTHRARDLGLVGLSQFLPAFYFSCSRAIQPTACRGSVFCKPASRRFRWSRCCC